MPFFSKKFLAPLALAAALLHACGEKTNPIFHPQPIEKQALAPTGKFELLAPERTGITFVPTVTDDYRYNFIQDPYIYNGGGVAVLDFDNDGLQDLFFTNRLQGCRLYRNLGNLKFEDVSEKSGVAKEGGLKTGAVTVDVNADGFMDIYVCRTWLAPLEERRNLLFVNNHDGTFTNRAREYGLDDLSASQSANFFDYDLDGDLDCYVLNHPVDFKSISQLDFVPSPAYKSARNQPPRNEFESDKLFENNGNQHFTDVSKKAGIQNRAFGLSVSTTDFNRDGYPDLFIGNDFLMPDFALVNQRNGTFRDEAEQFFGHTSNQTMGADIADLNRDGLPDIIACDMLAEAWTRRKRLMANVFYERDKKMDALGYGRQAMRNVVQLNNGRGQFSEIGCLAGVFATDWSWSPLLADFDNDGRCDLFISNGIKRDLNEMDFFLYTADSINHAGGVNPSKFPDFEKYAGLMPSTPVHNYLYQNVGSGAENWWEAAPEIPRFNDVSEAWGMGKPGFSNGAAYADLDNDGDLDLVTNNLGSPAGIYENKAVGLNQNHWLQIKLAGPPQNPMGIGAQILVLGANDKILFSGGMTNVRGFYSSSEPIWQIGLGKLDKVEKLQIWWPVPGKEGFQRLTNVSVNQRITLKWQDANDGLLGMAESEEWAFMDETKESGLDFRHHENDFEDFDRERLLPYRLSTPGPCVAAGDVNGDGLDDVFFGGATGQAGAIFLQKKDGTFARQPQPDLEKTAASEDAAALFFDADKDGDLDLYVGSGGNEEAAGSKYYQDRLFKNDGRGNFSLDEAALPKESESASCVRAHDFDGDGDLDLFVGSRCVPGRWPAAPKQLILKNEGGKFSNVTAEVAPDFEKIGMVTALELADLDGDKTTELLVACDWAPIAVFKFDGKIYQNATAKFGLENSSGRWNCLTVSDLDGDGDLDFAAGNEGLNTRLKTSPEAPLRLFANDFDRNGTLDPIVAVPDGDVYRPLAPRDLLAMQLAGYLKKKFPRHAPFAAATLTDVFPEKDLLAGQVLDVKTFESQWFENRGGKFFAHALPLESQVAPVHQLVAADFNGDSKIDLAAFGNDFGRDPETYRLDASVGCLLAGDGRGGFRAWPVNDSGLWAPGMVRGAALVKLAGGRRGLVVANNNAAAQFFEITN